jgi:lauroyl/myristoyl acyltransferase
MTMPPPRFSLDDFVKPGNSGFSFLFSRDVLRWKSWFYQGMLPLMASRGAARAGADLERLGTIIHDRWSPRRRQLKKIISPEVFRTGSGRSPDDIVRGISSQMLRYIARDCVLQKIDPNGWAELFEVEGYERVLELREKGQAAIFLGSHLGGHLTAVHWMIAHGLDFRALVQRPRNVSPGLDGWFDQDHAICDQRNLFLRRDLSPAEGARRTMDVRRLIRHGISIYTNCDICWSGPNTDSCRFLGQDVRFQSIWIDIAMLLGCPVIGVECRQIPGGRFRLKFEEPFAISSPDSRREVFERTISRLERSILEYPDDAIAHLTWSLFRPRRQMQPEPKIPAPAFASVSKNRPKAENAENR